MNYSNPCLLAESPICIFCTLLFIEQLSYLRGGGGGGGFCDTLLMMPKPCLNRNWSQGGWDSDTRALKNDLCTTEELGLAWVVSGN